MPISVLMISIDQGLLGGGQLGDVVERHVAYGANPAVGRLDIIVLGRGAREPYRLSPTVTAYPTNSRSKFGYYRDAVRLGNQLAAQHRYDLVVTQEPFLTGLVGLRLKQRFGLKLLVHHHGDFFDNPYWLAERPAAHRLLALLAAFVTKRADAVRSVSHGIADKIARRGVPPNRIRVIPTPVVLAKFADPALAREAERFRDSGKKIVLTVGRNDRAKDFPTLYRAIRAVAQRFPTLLFWQVGAIGVTPDQVRAAVGSGPQIRVTSQIPQHELAACYRACDVYVSASAHESFGKVLVEANACGKPVVATATTGANDIVENGMNGFLVPVGDAQALAEKIVYLLQHPDEAKAMGERGRVLVAERFDGVKNTQAVVRFWQDIVEGKLNTPPPHPAAGLSPVIGRGRPQGRGGASAGRVNPSPPAGEGGPPRTG